MPAPLIVICGPTATGKSELAIKLALEIDAEIINADSMQLYRGMDIGTAKVSEAQRCGVPHHLLDILAVNQDSSVAAYQEMARARIAEIQSRHKAVIIVGGTGLYIKAIIDDLDFPETDPVIRAQLELDARVLGSAALFARLQELDPAAALAIDSANSRRVIRALEVIATTGRPYSANLPEDRSSLYPEAMHFGLTVGRDELAPRISSRVIQMWESGFVDEVKQLIEDGLLQGSTAKKAIGYSQIISFLNGESDEEFAKESTIVATRQYVRRQETWFKRDARIKWLGTDEPHLESLLKKINS